MSYVRRKDFWNCVTGLKFYLPIKNPLEGYNRSINNKFYNAHPNFARFLDFLKKEEAILKIKKGNFLLEG